MKRRREPGPSLALVSICLAFATIGLDGLLPTMISVSIRISLLLVAVAVIVFVVIPWHDRRLRERPVGFVFHRVPAINASILKRQAGDSQIANLAQAKVFALALTRQAELRQRVVERYEPSQRTLRQRVTIDVQIPQQLLTRGENGAPNYRGPDLSTVYFPLLVPAKGKIHDSLEIYDGQNRLLSTLSYREYLLLVACVLRLFLAIVWFWSRKPGLMKEVSRLETEALQLVMARLERGGKLPDDLPIDAIDKIAQLAAPVGAARVARDSAVSIIQKLIRNFVVVVVVRPDESGRFVISYAQTLVPDVQLATSPRLFGKLVQGARIALGARPVDLTIDIENARTCQSYHLEVLGMDGLYLISQEPIDFEKTQDTPAVGGPTPPHLRFRARLGQSHAHFYARYFPDEVVAGGDHGSDSSTVRSLPDPCFAR